ncbi:MAG: NAD-dependent deacylase [Gammaproteobacteria bacterium]|nr:NAD-dependent deacylase [Gammaproteobacteria bacterium]NND59315.1 NAD-dependent deacylase [Gammaproteobacteria bacterium]
MPASLVARLREAERVVVLTGAGASADSGVPTFRDAQTGLWAQFRPQELATPEAFVANPERVWQWYAWRRELISKVEPNAGHYALARLQRHVGQLTVITQNVDGLHQRAGSTDVVEFHGNIFVNQCFAESVVLQSSELEDGEPPQCRRCGSAVRPGVVWFGESIPAAALDQALQATTQCDVFIAAGTAAEVYPAAGLLAQAGEQDALTVEINPEATAISDAADIVVRARCAVALPTLVEQLIVE